jgi:hypothetical protein
MSTVHLGILRIIHKFILIAAIDNLQTADQEALFKMI